VTTQSDQQKFESLLSQFSKQKPEVSRDEILALIAEKKGKVGGGYLTDQGALFLVASDMGVALNYAAQNSVKLSDLNPEIQDVNIEARVMSLSPVRTFIRKSDSKPGLLSRLFIYDETGVVGVSLWDAKALLPASSDFAPGDSIKITNAYVRAGLDGGLVLNVGEKGGLSKLDSTQSSDDLPLEKRAVTIDTITDQGKFLVVKGKVKGRPRQSSFGRPDGSSGTLVSLSIGSELDANKEMRVVIWENSNPVLLNLSDGERITLVNVRSKVGRAFGDSTGAETIELHGDESTTVLEYWQETLHWLKKSSSSLDLSPTHTRAPQRSDLTPFICRVLSIGARSQDATSVRLLLCDSQKRKFSATLTKGAIDDCALLKTDDVVVCKPESVDYLGLKLSCTKKGSLSKVGARRPDIPTSSTLETTIEKLSEGSIVSLEVMSLSESVSREVQTKDGLVRRTELSVGDPTGEIRLYAWRELSKLLDKIPAGQRMWIRAVEVQIHEGRKFLNFRNYSQLERNLS